MSLFKSSSGPQFCNTMFLHNLITTDKYLVSCRTQTEDKTLIMSIFLIDMDKQLHTPRVHMAWW